MPFALTDVRCWGRAGKHFLIVSISGSDPKRSSRTLVREAHAPECLWRRSPPPFDRQHKSDANTEALCCPPRRAWRLHLAEPGSGNLLGYIIRLQREHRSIV